MPQANAKAQHIAEVTALAHMLVDLATEQRSHSVVLEALISAYTSVAVCHPCCTQGAADLARNVAALIESHAAPHSAPPVH